MRKIVAIAGVAFSSLLFTGSAFAQGAPPPPPPGAPPPPPSSSAGASDDDNKKMGIGGDLQFLLPLGDFGTASGPLIGPVFRFGYRVIPALELTGRIGYLFGLSKTPDNAPSTVSVSYSEIPIWIGARYFILEPQAGLYAGGELALNLLTAHADFGGISSSTGVTREGINFAVGYVISKELPIDFRAQFSLINLLGKDTGESTFTALGLSAGYTFQF